MIAANDSVQSLHFTSCVFSLGEATKKREQPPNSLDAHNSSYYRPMHTASRELQSWSGLLCRVAFGNPWMHNGCQGEGLSEHSIAKSELLNAHSIIKQFTLVANTPKN